MKYFAIKIMLCTLLFNLGLGESFASTVTGTLVKFDNYQSDFVKPRNVHVWLPKGYSSSTEKYSVLYMHDGQNLFDNQIAYAGEWGVDEQIQRLMDAGEIRNTIVIGIWNSDQRFREYQPQASFNTLTNDLQQKLIKEYSGAPNSDAYLKFIVKELKPFIDKKFRTHSDVENTFMMGSSMGGLISIYAVAEYPSIFSGIAAVSTHWPVSLKMNNQVVSSSIIDYLEKKLSSNPKRKIYFDFGTETLDSWYQPHQLKMDQVMQKLGYDRNHWLTRKFEGHAHHEPSWTKRLDIPFKFLLGTGKKEPFTTNVMAPLIVETEAEWTTFEQQIRQAAKSGVDAVSVDVWWGMVEKQGDNQFNWTYYDKLFSKISNAGLKIVPIMSFHRCGGYEGDACNFPIPKWVWKHYEKQGVSPKQMMYQGENHALNDETVSLWQDQFIMPQYVEFMRAFKKQYNQRASQIIEINISLGPSGELRYPSYNPRDELCAFPTRSCFQAYSEAAVKDFQKVVLTKYQTLEAVNEAWNETGFSIKIDSIDKIQPPNDGSAEDGLASDFVQKHLHQNSQYGKDFIDWYHGALINHGKNMMQASIDAFDGEFSDIPLGMKVAGLHWQMSNNAPAPRIPEMAAGIIPSSFDASLRINGFGYSRITNMIASFRNQRKIFFHFTNLESEDAETVAGQKIFSQAKTLLDYVSTAANDSGIILKGENAMGPGVESDKNWDNIEAAIKRNNIRGLTILRVENVTANKVGDRRLQKFLESEITNE